MRCSSYDSLWYYRKDMEPHPTNFDKNPTVLREQNCFDCSNSYKEHEMEEEDRMGHEVLGEVRTRRESAMKRGGHGTNSPSRDVTDYDILSSTKSSTLRLGVICSNLGAVTGVTRPSLGVFVDGNGGSGPTPLQTS